MKGYGSGGSVGALEGASVGLDVVGAAEGEAVGPGKEGAVVGKGVGSLRGLVARSIKSTSKWSSGSIPCRVSISRQVRDATGTASNQGRIANVHHQQSSLIVLLACYSQVYVKSVLFQQLIGDNGRRNDSFGPMSIVCSLSCELTNFVRGGEKSAENLNLVLR